MKKFLLGILLGTSFLISCGNGNSSHSRKTQVGDQKTEGVTYHAPGKDEVNTDGREAHIAFVKDFFVNADIRKGEVVNFRYEFVNDGEGDLKIYACIADCDCVEVSYPDGLIGPGERDYIDVKYNSEGYSDVIEHSIIVNSNSKSGNALLSFRGLIVE